MKCLRRIIEARKISLTLRLKNLAIFATQNNVNFHQYAHKFPFIDSSISNLSHEQVDYIDPTMGERTFDFRCRVNVNIFKHYLTKQVKIRTFYQWSLCPYDSCNDSTRKRSTRAIGTVEKSTIAEEKNLYPGNRLFCEGHCKTFRKLYNFDSKARGSISFRIVGVQLTRKTSRVTNCPRWRSGSHKNKLYRWK